MQRWVWARRHIAGSPERLTDTLVKNTPELLQTATGVPIIAPRGDGSFELRLVGRVMGVAPRKVVLARLGEALRRDNCTSIPLHWKAVPGSHVFPEFHGWIELETLSVAGCELSVVGHYDPPFTPLGDVADVMGVWQVAQDTTQWLAERLSRALSQEVYGTSPPPVRRVGALAVKDIMTEEPVVLIEDMSLRTGAALLLRFGISGAPVVNEDGLAVGVLSERDLLDKASTFPLGFGRKVRKAEQHTFALTVGQACTRPARTTQADSLVRDAAREMALHDVDRLIVLEGGALTGIVTRTDVLKALARNREDVDQAVHDVLADLKHEQLEVTNDEGVVHVAGTVTLYSQVRRIHDRLAEIDGVMNVECRDLSWQVDDRVPAVYPFH